MKTYSAAFAILIGVGMLGMWAMFFVSGDVPELQAAPVALAFHLAAELMTALSLLVAGVGIVRDAPWARALYLYGLGAFAYTAVVSPGYFAQEGQWAFVAMFAALLAAAVPAATNVIPRRESVVRS